MNVLTFLIPISVSLGLLALVAFIWTLRSGQYEDPDGDQARALSDEFDDHPGPR
ncbi:cbb3-type cytochrome oxidase assembly protein CcoS [Palleronia caenipelagi]|uniref:Cbb3-type cytochrome oxidase assembly protein CcoS n=1 Tax=Palleronia caenipelagi TaxID=2489174 RepID=A0A547PTH0_9RHOB|nr:cbb3-type cytochrome oxidase assembly protein CcoS [Palleronia caenipelagi]TRD17364.1 cbb3-type cytochrome oxidase assembly protein CcoS [Palleronia caenipelagi]